MELKQHHVIRFVRIKGLKLGGIGQELSSAYGPDVYTPPSIQYWLHEIKLGRTDLGTQHAGGRPPLNDTDPEILSLLRKYPFSLVRTIADSLEIPASTVYFHLVEKIGLKNLLLRWVSHMSTSKLRQKRIELSSQLPRMLESQQTVGFRHVVTGDESWVLQHYNHRQIWCTSADEVPARVTLTTSAQKTMLTVLLSIDGAILINWLTAREKFNSGYFYEKTLELLFEVLHGGSAAGSEG
jgi:hypothetical protein